MKINTRKIKYLNTLMKSIRENRVELIEMIRDYICPKKVEDCDSQLEFTTEAKECEYFTLCNVLGSYSLQLEEDQKEIDKFLEGIHTRLEQKSSIEESLFS